MGYQGRRRREWQRRWWAEWHGVAAGPHDAAAGFWRVIEEASRVARAAPPRAAALVGAGWQGVAASPRDGGAGWVHEGIIGAPGLAEFCG